MCISSSLFCLAASGSGGFGVGLGATLRGNGFGLLQLFVYRFCWAATSNMERELLSLRISRFASLTFMDDGVGLYHSGDLGRSHPILLFTGSYVVGESSYFSEEVLAVFLL